MKKVVTAGALALVVAGCSAARAERSPGSVTGAASTAAAPFASERLSVEVRGSGPDVVLIPGLASSRTVWGRTADQLDDTRRVHLVQVNGFAGAPAGANAAGPVFDALVEEVNRYIRAQGLKRPAVIGHSMGGAAALALASRHPDAVGPLLVVDALPFFSVLMNPAATEDSARPAAQAVVDAMRRSTPEQFAASQTGALAGLVKNTEARARRARESGLSDKAVVAQVTYDVMTTDLRPELSRITAPVTVLYPYDRETFRVGLEVVEPVYARS